MKSEAKTPGGEYLLSMDKVNEFIIFCHDPLLIIFFFKKDNREGT